VTDLPATPAPLPSPAALGGCEPGGVPPARLDVRAVLFDVNGTLIEIRTEDHADDVYRAAGHYLTYQGIDLRRHEVRESYLAELKAQRAESGERWPEFDAVEVWRRVVARHATDFTRGLPAAKRAQIPVALAELTRGVARRRLKLYPHVRAVLDVLASRFALAVVSDAQSAWARAELAQVDLLHRFDPVVVSGDLGYRKPDPRLFRRALDALGLRPDQAVYVGNDMYRDVFGAREVGMYTVMFDSDQGTKEHEDTEPHVRITDHRDLPGILEALTGTALPPLPAEEAELADDGPPEPPAPPP